MPRPAILKFDRGTLVLHPPPKGKAWIDFATWDDRIERFRIPANQYRVLVETLQAADLFGVSLLPQKPHILEGYLNVPVFVGTKEVVV